jgi:mannose-6-phosphate isomerase-like protein (cupin superfamily)
MKKRLKHQLLDKRPWGQFEQFTLNEKSTVKIITVKPNKRLSLQTHKNRKEFWYFLDNPAKVTINSKTYKVKKGSQVQIPKGAKHRVQALSKPSRFLEIATGTFNEKDIKRLEDDFGRDKK